MKLVTSASNLKSGLLLLRGLIQKHASIPLIRCVQISGDMLSGTDLDNDLSIRIAVKEATGTAAVDYEQLLEIVRLIPPSEEVTLTQTEDMKAVLCFGASRYCLYAARADEYRPAITIPPGKPKVFRCGNAGLAAAFRRVSHAISTEETRYYLNGACLTKDKDGNPYVVATDGHRMCAKHIPAAKHFDNQIIQRRAINFILRLGEPTEFHYWPAEKVVRFEFSGASLVTKLIDGSFPDWTRVVPEMGDTRLTLDTVNAKAALKRLSVGPEKSAHVTFLLQDGGVIAARTAIGGDRYEVMPHSHSSVGADGPSAITINAKYITEQIAHTGDEEVEFCLLSDHDPILSKSDGVIDILMPCRGMSADDVRAMLPAAPTARQREAA